jgi:hypothetical protein
VTSRWGGRDRVAQEFQRVFTGTTYHRAPTAAECRGSAGYRKADRRVTELSKPRRDLLARLDITPPKQII